MRGVKTKWNDQDMIAPKAAYFTERACR